MVLSYQACFSFFSIEIICAGVGFTPYSIPFQFVQRGKLVPGNPVNFSPNRMVLIRVPDPRK